VTHSEYEHELRESIKRREKLAAELGRNPFRKLRVREPSEASPELGVVWGKRRPVN
jgi:hypothetical protein